MAALAVLGLLATANVGPDLDLVLFIEVVVDMARMLIVLFDERAGQHQLLNEEFTLQLVSSIEAALHHEVAELVPHQVDQIALLRISTQRGHYELQVVLLNGFLEQQALLDEVAAVLVLAHL